MKAKPTSGIKRSRNIRLVAMGAVTASAVTACSNNAEPPSTPVFTSVEQCAAAGEYTERECEAALKFALQQQAVEGTQQYRSRNECENFFGPNQCHSYPTPGGGNIWMGLLGGFLLGQMIDGRRDYYYYNYGGHWTTYDARAGRINRSYRPPANLPKPANATIPKPTRQHTAAITRGGFGRSARSGSSWGG